MAKNKEKKNGWSIRKEKKELVLKLQKLRMRHEELKDQKEILINMLSNAILDHDDKKISYLRDEIADIKTEIDEVDGEYNRIVDVINGLEQADTTHSNKISSWANVCGTIILGAVGLGLTHRDAINGFLKDKNAEPFFQTAWRSLFGRKS